MALGRAYDYLGAVTSRRFGRCIVCGQFALFIYRRRVVTPRLQELWGLTPRLADALARKESGDCSHCGAKLRGRRIAQALLSLYPGGIPPAHSLASGFACRKPASFAWLRSTRLMVCTRSCERCHSYAGSDYQRRKRSRRR